VSRSCSGTCHLCRRSPVELRRSHIIPSWAYKRMRLRDDAVEGTKRKNPNPVLLREDQAVQVSNQITDDLLCDDCEQRFGVDERYAADFAYQADGTAPRFFETITLMDPQDQDAVRGAFANGIELGTLARFGAGVLWRAHVSKEAPGCSLGDRYGEEFRRYLFAEADFPLKRSRLHAVSGRHSWVGPGEAGRACLLPNSRRLDGFHSHTILVCGMHFEFVVGGRIDEDYREFCLVRGPHRCVILNSSDDLLEQIKPQALRAIRAKRKGL
jgi:hypothetical protein